MVQTIKKPLSETEELERDIVPTGSIGLISQQAVSFIEMLGGRGWEGADCGGWTLSLGRLITECLQMFCSKKGPCLGSG